MSNARELRRLGVSDVDQHLGEIVSAIPAGRVTTYGALADAAGTSARYVGRFLGRRGHNLPWWRVVNAAGNPVPAAGTEALQRLIDDGVPLSSDGSGPSHYRRFCCPPGSTGTTAASDAHPASDPLPGSGRL